MEPAVEKRFKRIETLIHAMDERETRIEPRFKRRKNRADSRKNRSDRRMDKFDRGLERTRQLVEVGMKIVLQIGQRQKATEIGLDRLEKSVEAFVNSMKRAGNGSRQS
jgi:hypothetical protein